DRNARVDRAAGGACGGRHGVRSEHRRVDAGAHRDQHGCERHGGRAGDLGSAADRGFAGGNDPESAACNEPWVDRNVAGAAPGSGSVRRVEELTDRRWIGPWLAGMTLVLASSTPALVRA